MHFPLVEQLALPCVFERVVPGKLHPDGRRYLPLLILRLLPLVAHGSQRVPPITPPDLRLGVVDRHHLIDQRLAGSPGVARLLCLLSTVRLQPSPYRQGLQPEPGYQASHVSTAPRILGQVVAVPTWEREDEHLAFEKLYTELLVDTGLGVVGVRTNMTADTLAEAIGAARIIPGDWIEVDRSRIDILAFVPDAHSPES